MWLGLGRDARATVPHRDDHYLIARQGEDRDRGAIRRVLHRIGQKVHDDPPGPAAGTIKIEKGGWWGSNLYVARSAYRHYEDPPDYADQHIGFRIVSPES
jgi:formylglycine-generating enzyme required for sulfatase activity